MQSDWRGCIVGLDLGTTSCRALVFSSDGRVLSQSQVLYPLEQPRPGWAVQDPGVLWQAVLECLRGAVARAPVGHEQIVAVGLSTYFHSLLALDGSGAPLTPVLTWADTRAVDEADALKAEYGTSLYARTGCPLHTLYPLSKLVWLRTHEPDLFARARRFASAKDWLVLQLTGQWAVDHSIATGSGMFNLQRMVWDEEVLAVAGARPEQLPPALPGTTQLPMRAAVAAEVGLRPGTPVVLGAGDGVLASLGSGGAAPGSVTCTVGTSGAVRAVAPAPRVHPRGATWCYGLLPGTWYLGGAINNGGIALRWFKENLWTGAGALVGGDPYDAITAQAAGAPAGSGGLLFLPFLTGERSPGWNARARGVLFGLGLHHTNAHIARSVLEGVAFRLKSVLQTIEELVGGSQEIRCSGGFARSPAWLQIVADVLGCEVAVPAQTEGSALGAALIAAHALGREPELTTRAAALAPVVHRYTPDAGNSARYAELYALYDRVYHHLQGEFSEITRLQG